MIRGSRPKHDIDHVKRPRQPKQQMSELDWNLLQSVLTVARARSYRQAAQRISINTLRSRIERLERATGKKLFDTSVSGVAPTAHGLAIIEAAASIETIIAQVLQATH